MQSSNLDLLASTPASDFEPRISWSVMILIISLFPDSIAQSRADSPLSVFNSRFAPESARILTISTYFEPIA